MLRRVLILLLRDKRPKCLSQPEKNKCAVRSPWSFLPAGKYVIRAKKTNAKPSLWRKDDGKLERLLTNLSVESRTCTRPCAANRRPANRNAGSLLWFRLQEKIAGIRFVRIGLLLRKCTGCGFDSLLQYGLILETLQLTSTSCFIWTKRTSVD